MLTASEAFKVGFLARCVEDGLTPDRIAASVKTAADLMEKDAILGGLLGQVADFGKGAVGAAAKYGIPAAIAAPPMLGAAGAYGLSRLTDIDDRDVEDVKNREVVEEYARQTEKLRRHKAVKEYLKSRQKTGRIFM